MDYILLILLAAWIGFLLFGGVGEFLQKKYGGNIASIFILVGICGGILLVGSWVR